MNVNLLLENSARCELIGRNMTTWCMLSHPPYSPEGGNGLRAIWPDPAPGLNGQLALGHHLDVCDAAVPHFLFAGKQLVWHATRNRWTPAWMDTYYLSQPSADNSIEICLHERKCILPNDVFVSHMTLTNLRSVAVTIKVEWTSPLCGEEPFDQAVLPHALGTPLHVKGWGVLVSDLDDSTFEVTLSSFGSVELRTSFAFDPVNRTAAINRAQEVLKNDKPFDDNERYFNNWMCDHAPAFSCDDPCLTRLYYYRWMLVYRNIFKPCEVIPNHFIRTECLYESPFGSWFGSPVGLSIPLQIDECSWMRTDKPGRAQIDNWVIGHGNYRWYIQYTPQAIWQFYQLHPDREWLSNLYPTVREYSLNKTENGLPVTTGSWGTGAEYQPSFYQHATPAWDWRQDVEGIRLGLAKASRTLNRLDEESYAIANLRACEHMACELGLSKDTETLRNRANDLIASQRALHWDDETHLYWDYDIQAEKKCDQAACYDSFAPYMWQLTAPEDTHAFDKLFDPAWFRDSFGSASVAHNCPMYWPDDCIAGPCASSPESPHQYRTSWNGPVWPYACSLVTEALGAAARSQPTLRNHWLEYFNSWSELHFIYGDRSIPCAVEHYRGSDGVPFSTYVDYFHSNWLNAFFKYWIGVRLEGDEPRFEPYTAMDFELSGLCIGDREYSISMHNGSLSVSVSSKLPKSY